MKQNEQNDSGQKLQTIKDGTGALFHRRYFVDFKSPKHNIDELMAVLKKDINSFSPQLLAKFKKRKGEPEVLQVGDEFDITLSGPWNAPVRVSEVKPHSFLLSTLGGHPEAGQIEFGLKEISEGCMRFEIESFARSKDSIVNLLYDAIPVVRMAQTTMWVLFCESFVRHATGEFAEGIGIVTERFDPEKNQWERD